MTQPTVATYGGIEDDPRRYQDHPTRRWPSGKDAIYFRLRRAGARTQRCYLIRFKGQWVPVDGGLKDAEAKRDELTNSKRKGEKPILPTKLTYRELAESWAEIRKSKVRHRTSRYDRDALDNVLLPRFGSWLVPAVDADAISSLIVDLGKEGLHAIDKSRPVRPLGESSITNYLKPLRSTLKLAARRRLISVDPFTLLTKDERPKNPERKPTRIPTEKEFGAILTKSAELATQKTSKYDGYTLLLDVTGRCCLRLGEVLGLTWADFDKDASILHVRRQWLTSGQHGPLKTGAKDKRESELGGIPLPKDLCAKLIALRLESEHSQDHHPIFASHKGTPLSHRNVAERGFDRAAEKAGIEGMTFHHLRHYGISRAIAAGLPITTVAALAGHSDPTTTLRVYAHLFDKSKQQDALRAAL